MAFVVIIMNWTESADPVFPRDGGANHPGGANVRFCQKLHEIERIWIPRGTCPWRPPRSANENAGAHQL